MDVQTNPFPSVFGLKQFLWMKAQREIGELSYHSSLNIKEYTSFIKEKSREKCKNYGTFGMGREY